MIAENTERLSDLQKVMREVDSFVNSNVTATLERYESEIKTYQNSLMELMNKKSDIEQVISKLKEEITSQEIGKRELIDNMALRKAEEMVNTSKEKYSQLREKLNSMNYNEMVNKFEQLDSEKQSMLRQVSDKSCLYICCSSDIYIKK